MKLTRKELRERLTADGVPADKLDDLIDAICDAHSTSVNAVRQQAQNGSQSEGNDWKEKYEALVAANEARETREAKESALKAMLEGSKLSDKGKTMVLKYTNLDEIELDAAGNVKGAKKKLDSIHEEWSDYVVEQSTEGVNTGNNNSGNNNSGNSMTREDIMKITDATARQKAIAENHELFGF